MNDSEKKKLILAFIKRHKLCVLSTVTPDNKSESAVIEFGETDDLELVFDTLEHYRKFNNLKLNGNVSVVIGWDEDITVQYEGEAHELGAKQGEKYREAYWRKNPKAKKWEERPGVKFFKVIPAWIRYSDLSVNPWKIEEIKC